MSPSPPTISISFSNGADGQLKDTARNIIKTSNGFTVNLISEPWIENAHVCAIDFPKDESEWPVSGLTQEPSVSFQNLGITTTQGGFQTIVKSPRVKESAYSLECEVHFYFYCRNRLLKFSQLFQAVDIIHPETKLCTATLVIGLVKMIHIRNDVYNQEDGEIDTRNYQVVSRLGDAYARLGDGFKLPSGNWKRDQHDIKKALSDKEE